MANNSLNFQHGITRTPYSKEARSEALCKEELLKISEYNSLVNQVYEARNLANYTASALKLTSDLLKRNPEFSTIWNYRKEILLRGIFPSILCSSPSEETTNEYQEIHNLLLQIIKTELSHIIPLLESHPKCYSLWNHRLWTLGQSTLLLPTEVSSKLWYKELDLVSMMLGRDERNFHGWMYRRFVVGAIEGRDVTVIGASTSNSYSNNTITGGNYEEHGKDQRNKKKSLVESEFAYTTSMIKANMSNYSAWHNRSKLIPLLLDERKASKQERMDFLEDEIIFVRAALLTKPQDQSLWFYHQWLIHTNASPLVLSSFASSIAKLPYSTKLALVRSQMDELQEMLKIHPDHRKWILATLVRLVGLQRRLRDYKPVAGEESEEEEEEEEEDELGDEEEMKMVKEWLGELIVIDGGKEGKGRRWVDLERRIENGVGW